MTEQTLTPSWLATFVNSLSDDRYQELCHEASRLLADERLCIWLTADTYTVLAGTEFLWTIRSDCND